MPKPSKVIKAFEAGPSVKGLRRKYNSDLRDVMLRAQGLPDNVIPYGLDDDSVVIYPGNGTPDVRRAVLLGFSWSFNECANHADLDSVTLYQRYPWLHGEATYEEARPLIEQTKAQAITHDQAAKELERITRDSRPSLKNYPPSAEHRVSATGRVHLAVGKKLENPDSFPTLSVEECTQVFSGCHRSTILRWLEAGSLQRIGPEKKEGDTKKQKILICTKSVNAKLSGTR